MGQLGRQKLLLPGGFGRVKQMLSVFKLFNCAMAESLKVTKIGNSAGLILSKETLNALDVRVGDILYATRTSDGSIRLTASSPEFEEQMKIAREGMRRYRNTLKELAK